MKILYVIPSYEPAWAFGGTVTATSNLCRALAKKGIDVTVYTTDSDGKGRYLDVPLNQPVDLGGVKVCYFHCDLFPRKAFYSKMLKRKLEENVKDFDLIHVSAIWQWIGVDVNKICRKNNIPYIVSPNGSFILYPWKQNIIKKRIYWKFFGKKTVKNADAIHFTTEAEREDSVMTIPLLKSIPNFVIPNGIESTNEINSIVNRKTLNIPEDKFIILFVGRIHRIKGLELVIKALGLLQEKDIYFLIVGPDEDKIYCNYLKELSEKLHITNKIIWYGPINRSKLWNFYKCADLYVQMSYSENFAMAAVEAMTFGLPILISNKVGIWREVQEDNAGFVINQDVNEIAKILKMTCEKPQILKEMSELARKSAEKRYDINKVADLMIMAYEDILTGKRSPELQWR
jgi:glycosyltransferase involved in cell wall biosynthesis